MMFDLFLSTNNGTSWTEVNSGPPDSAVVSSVAICGNNIFDGTWGEPVWGVWRRPLSDMTWIIDHNTNPEIVKQVNYKIASPNHINPALTIEFSRPHPEQVTVTIYNLNGRELAIPADINPDPYSYRFLWDTRNRASGCYAVRMRVGKNTSVKSSAVTCNIF